MIEQYTSPAVVNNSQEPWLVGEGVSLSGSIAIPSLDFNFVTNAFPGTVTFTRASSATMFDSSGTLVYAPMNLLLHSEDFATTWSALNVTPSTNTSLSPAGTLTADTLTPAASTAAHLISQSATVTASTAYSASVFVKSDGAPFVQIVYDNGASVGAFINVNLSTGAITRGPELAGGATNATGGVVPIGNGFYRVSIGATHTGTTGRVLISPLPAGQSAAGLNPSTTTAATDKIIVWGAQLNIANMQGGVTGSLSTYYPTTSAAYQGPRLDYDPATLLPRGFLVEEQRTNSIRNNTMQGAVAGTPGTNPTNWVVGATADGLTKEIVGTGTSNGITYVDIRWSGTSGAAATSTLFQCEAQTQIAALNGQTWTGSMWVALVGGTLTNVSLLELRIRYNDAGGTLLTQAGVTVSTATSTMQRFATAQTASNASTAFVNVGVIADFVNSSAVDFTLRIGLPQLELGAFATSVIPTTTTALTRSADVAAVNTLSPWFNATEGTLYAEVSAASGFNVTGSFGRYAGIQDALNNNSVEIFFDGNSNLAPRYRVRSGGANQAIGSSATAYTANTVLKSALGYQVNSFAGVSRGVVDLTDTSGAVPVSPTFLSLGSEGGTINYLNGHLRRITYYPRRLSDAELQAITA